MPVFLRRYVLTLLVFLSLDMIWIVGLMFRFYDSQLGALALRGPDGHLAANLPATALVYLLIPAGFVVFALPGVIASWRSLPKAAFFGLVCYGTYDLSNLATLKGWPVPVVMADMFWGALVTTLTCAIVSLIERRLAKGA